MLPFDPKLDSPTVASSTASRAIPTISLAFNEMEHRWSRLRSAQANRFVERFDGTVLDEFFPSKMRKTLYRDVDSLQPNIDGWPHH